MIWRANTEEKLRKGESAICEARKDLFVKKLGQLLAMTREGITEAEYEKSYDFEDKKEFVEFVVVRFNGGSEKRINVTFDSNMGIMRDVLKAI